MREPVPSLARPPVGAEAPRRGVYGYEVRSSERLRYLRRVAPASADPPVRVAVADDGVRPAGEPIRRWLPRPGNPFRADLYGDGPYHRLWIEGLGWYRVDLDAGEVWMPPGADPLRREERLYGIPLALLMARRGALPLHAATVRIRDAAVALAAPGRHGKTTLAAALLAAGHRLLSEDVSCLLLGPRPAVVPGPALLRVRPDAFERLSLRDARITLASADRVHLAIGEDADADPSPAPLRAILFLRPSNGIPEVRPVPPHEAVRSLWALSMKLPTEEDRARCFAEIAELADRVPAYDLVRPTRWDLLPATVERIVEVARS